MEYNIYDQRLLAFAEHLRTIKDHPEKCFTDKCNLVNLEHGVRMEYQIEWCHWVMEELVCCDTENWSWHLKTGMPVLDDMLTENTMTCVCFYFNLGPEELTHLFDISIGLKGEGYQNILFKGNEQLTRDSDGDVYYRNIIRFVEWRQRKDD